MIITSLTSSDKGKTKVCLDNGTDFSLYKSECRRFDLEEGKELTESQYETIVKEILLPRCKKRGLHLLEKQDRSRKNLWDKLSEGGYPDEVVDAAIEYIDSFGYIDDARMAGSYVRFYQDSRSRGRIKQDLLKKGISSDVIEIVMEEEYKNDEIELIESLMVKKHYDKETASYEEKAKMYRFLAGRGFSPDVINKALR